MSVMLSRFDKMDKMMAKMNKNINLCTAKIDHIMSKKQKASLTAFMDARKDAEEDKEDEDEDKDEDEQEEDEDDQEEDEEAEDEEDEDKEDEEDDDALEVRAKKKNDKL